MRCPRCDREVPDEIAVCWHCGHRLYLLHRKCGVCGKSVGHGRHRDDGGLWYVCGCGYKAKTLDELNLHLEEVGAKCVPV